MIRWIALALALALIFACTTATPPPLDAAAPRFTVATWNVQQLVDEFDNPYFARDTDSEFQKPPEQIAAIVETIRSLNADVIAFQEIEGSSFLHAFAQEHFPDMGYEHFVSCPSDDWHQNVAVMSRFPLGPLTSMTAVMTPVPHFEEGETNLVNNRLLAVEVYPAPDYELLLLVVHLKAGGRDTDRAWRRGQIEFLRGWLEEQRQANPDLNMCVLGDFNSTPDSEEMRMWTDPESGQVFRSLLSEVGMPPTHPAWNPGRTIDQILANDNLWDEHLPESTAVFTDIGPEEGERLCSDHLPVSAVFVARDR